MKTPVHGALAASLLQGQPAPVRTEATKPPPNILFIMADQVTPFMLGPYGQKVAHTPNLDELATQGHGFGCRLLRQPALRAQPNRHVHGPLSAQDAKVTIMPRNSARTSPPSFIISSAPVTRRRGRASATSWVPSRSTDLTSGSRPIFSPQASPCSPTGGWGPSLTRAPPSAPNCKCWDRQNGPSNSVMTR